MGHEHDDLRHRESRSNVQRFLLAARPFRTGSGEYGLVEQRCSHRGASLEYGVITENGITCAYHGFKYAPDDTILETGAGAPLAHGGKVCLGTFPCTSSTS